MRSSEEIRETVHRALLNSALKLGAGVDSQSHRLAWILDCRELSLHGEFLPLIAELLWPLIDQYSPTVIAGPTVSADPLVSALILLAASKGKSVIGALVRPTAKSYGLRKEVE